MGWLGKIIIPAIKKFYATPEDRDLIERDVSERSIVTCIYYNMRQELEKLRGSDSELDNLHIDIEYNRNGVEPKYAHKEKCDDCGKKHCMAKILYCRLCKKGMNYENFMVEVETKGMEPDLIIHKRGSNEMNKVVIEFKKQNQKRKRKDDMGKLTYFTCNEKYKEHPGNDYNYQCGYFIDLGKDSCEIISFENGEEVGREKYPPFPE